MEKLYYTERYTKQWESYVRDIEKVSDKEGLVLEETIFFPGGGGQACDLGKIIYTNTAGEEEERRVIETLLNDKDEIVHILDKASNKLDKNKKVRLELDWDRREDYMCQHTGQHILSGCFESLFGRNTTGLHIGKEMSQLDIEGKFDDEMVEKIEKMANEIIHKSLEVKNYVLTSQERKTFKTRRPLPDTQEDIRILEIPDLDINACCGVHVLNTGDIRFIKIKKYYKHKSGTRFEYLAGPRAINYVLERENIFQRVLDLFNCDEQNIESAIDNLNLKKEELYNSNKYITQKFVHLYSQDLIKEAEENKDGVLLVKKVFEDEEKNLITEIAKYIAENKRAIVLLGNKSKDLSSLNLQCSKKLVKELSYIDLGGDFKKYSKELGLKGGGSKFAAQGVCTEEKNIDIFLDTIYHIYVGK